MKDISILVVDDQQLVRAGLVRMLEDIPGMFVQGDANSGEEGLAKIKQLHKNGALPDVVLMDMRMPGIGGLEATRKIIERYPQVKVIGLSGCNDQPFPRRFLECGASGFVAKDAGIDELAQAVRSVFRGKHYLSQLVAQEMAMVRVQWKDSDNETSPFDRLSERELQTALMVIDGTKVNVIAEYFSVSPKTVHTYRYRIFEKLNIENDMELAMLATRYGLLEPHERYA